MCSDDERDLALPRELLDSCYTAADGKRAWKRADAMKAIGEITAHGGAITTVEVWLVIDDPPFDGTHTNVVHTSESTARYYRWEMETAWDGDAESWNDFAERSGMEAVSWINAVNPEAEALAPDGKHVSFHVEYAGQGSL